MIMVPKKTIFFKIQPSLNRAATYTIYANSIPINFTIGYHKRTCGLAFTLNESPKYLIENGIKLLTFRDLGRSDFATKFFNLDFVQNEKLDYKGKFVSIKNKFKDDIFQYFGEKTDFQIRDEYEIPNKKCSNYLLSLGFKIENHKEDLAFLIFQRKCYSPKNMRFVCRNYSLQFTTEAGEKLLTELVKMPE